MSNQTETSVKAAKPERSDNHQSCRLAYETLVSATKAFVHHFSTLVDEEKVDFKSLANHTKLLDKCLTSVKASQPKKVAVAAKAVLEQPLEAAEASSKKSSSRAKKEKVESSPTAQEVQTVTKAAATPAPVAATPAASSTAAKKTVTKSK
jgi:hypothetical protein